MRKAKVITGFTRYNETELISLATVIVEKMTENADFPDPTPSIQQISKDLKEFTALIEKCVEGTRKDTINKNNKKAELILKLSNLGSYINVTANGDAAKLGGTGYPIAKQPESVGILPAPEYIRISDSDHSGEFYVEIARVPKAAGYLVRYAELPVPEESSQWSSKVFANTKGVLSGLKSATKYAVKASAMSKASEDRSYHHYSPAVERVTQ